MRVAYFDCFAGVSGDMIVGALIDAGCDLAHLESELGKLGVSGYRVAAAKTERNGISGTKFDVETDEGGHGRTGGEIVAVIRDSGLDQEVKVLCERVIMTLARAEAKIHNTSVDEVRLHEAGGLDAIVDVVASVVGLRRLGVEAIHASAIHLGTGFVECEHGTLPVPAPATLELLRGIPVYSRGIQAELATPTGVAILGVLSEGFGSRPPMEVSTVGYGAGSRTLEIPNLLRVTLGEAGEAREGDDVDGVVLIEANLDDMNPEFFEHVSDLLWRQGALDVTMTPIVMKKGRPGITLSVLAPPGNLDDIVTVLVTETTTLGVRFFRLERRTLDREIVTIGTRFGAVRVKIARRDGRVMNIAPEYEDCREIALASGVPLKDVYDEAKAAARTACPTDDEPGVPSG